ncbi:MAG: ATP-dependent helicase [Microthrixaceae bacterium]
MFRRLNSEQQRAVEFTGAPLRILAGAGTGKTTTLTARVAFLVASGIPADRVMLLTFTRRAAREMVSRTESALAADNRASRSRVVGGTFHSVAHRVLRRNAVNLGLPEGYSILDTSDAADLIDLVRNDVLGARSADAGSPSGKRFPRKATLLDLYSRAVNTQQPLSTVIDKVAPWSRDQLEPIVEICRSYVARKKVLGLLDFDDLLLYWRAAAMDDQLGPRLAAGIDHICVDEYQDVNALQVDLLRALRSTNDALTVVGDDSQAVYGFRGSSPDHLLDVGEVFPRMETINLSTNYRSTQAILDVANAVADDAPRGFMARLSAVDPGGPAPQLVRCADEDGQVTAVCESVLAHREEGIELREQAVLVRASHHSALLELELSRRRIPFVKYGGLRFLEAAHVKDLVCLFRLADNPRDELSWFRLLQLIEGVGPVRARRAIVALGVGETGTPAEVLLRWPLAQQELPASARESASSLIQALAPIDQEPIPARAERLRDSLVPLIEAAYENAEARIADLDALVAASADVAQISDVAAELLLEPPNPTGDLAGEPLIDEDWLVISTVHSAKGLEWDVVHILNAADGNFPSDMALSTKEGLEEERRLFYVAVTRARKALNVYHPLRFHFRPGGRDDHHTYAQPSRFLSSSVASHFERVESSHNTLVRARSGDAAAVVEMSLDSLWC